MRSAKFDANKTNPAGLNAPNIGGGDFTKTEILPNAPHI
jgi:hypothetical protein